MWARVAIVLGLLGVVSAAPVAAPVTAQPATTSDGEIIDFEIHPPPDPLTAGDSIVFTNNGARPHTVTDRGGTFDTDPILPGAQAELTFDVPGTYEVFCRINPSRMNATIVVERGDEEPAEVRVQAFDENREGEVKRFDPAQIIIESGTAITLANVGGLPHSLAADDGSFSTGVVAPGAEQGRFAGTYATIVITEPGRYDLICEIHPAAMQATLAVTGEPPEETPVVVGDDDEEAAQDVEAGGEAAVDIVDFAFEPTEISVVAGGEIVWTNTGDAPHTATFDDLELDTGRIEPGSDATLVAPDAPGTYSYFCAIHNSMRGAVLVPPPEDDGEQAAPDAPDDDDDAAADDAADATPTPISLPPSESGGAKAFAYVVAVALVGTAALGLLLTFRSRPA